MNSISGAQLSAALLITDMFWLCCMRGSISAAAIAGVLAASALQFLMVLVYAVRGRELSRVGAVFFLVYSLFWGGMIFSELRDTSDIIGIPVGSFMAAGLAALVCLYISSTGMKALGRAAVIAAAVGIALIATDLLSAVFHADWSDLFAPRSRGAWGELVRGFSVSGSLGSLAVFLCDVKGDRLKTAAGYFAARAVISAAVLLTALAVTGGIMELTEFPVMTAAQLSQPFEAQRIDSLFLVVFSVFAVFAAALQIMTGARLLQQIFPRFGRWKSTAVTAFVLASDFIICGRELLLIRACAAAAALMAGAAGRKKAAARSSG